MNIVVMSIGRAVTTVAVCIAIGYIKGRCDEHDYVKEQKEKND